MFRGQLTGDVVMIAADVEVTGVGVDGSLPRYGLLPTLVVLL
jgi:hypothetical protein